LSEAERAKILAIANSEEFKDRPPHQIVPILAELGEYIASESSFYRILRTAKQLTHRHASSQQNPRSKLKALRATAPNQLYSWDITYLTTQVKGQFFYLYLFMDIFSRKIVGWQVYHEESSQNATDLVCDICQREQIQREQLILHSDNGSPLRMWLWQDCGWQILSSGITLSIATAVFNSPRQLSGIMVKIGLFWNGGKRFMKRQGRKILHAGVKIPETGSGNLRFS
jgi:transposase InsO family protein